MDACSTCTHNRVLCVSGPHRDIPLADANHSVAIFAAPICNKPVPIETAKTDSDGKAIHEDCYFHESVILMHMLKEYLTLPTLLEIAISRHIPRLE